MENDLFWNSYTGVADIVLHASRGERSLVENGRSPGILQPLVSLDLVLLSDLLRTTAS